MQKLFHRLLDENFNELYERSTYQNVRKIQKLSQTVIWLLRV